MLSNVRTMSRNVSSRMMRAPFSFRDTSCGPICTHGHEDDPTRRYNNTKGTPTRFDNLARDSSVLSLSVSGQSLVPDKKSATLTPPPPPPAFGLLAATRTRRQGDNLHLYVVGGRLCTHLALPPQTVFHGFFVTNCRSGPAFLAGAPTSTILIIYTAWKLEICIVSNPSKTSQPESTYSRRCCCCAPLGTTPCVLAMPVNRFSR